MEEFKEEPAELPHRGPLIQGNSNVRRGKKNSSCNEWSRVKVLFSGRLCGFEKGLEKSAVAITCYHLDHEGAGNK